jgi:hypothetical protein
VLERANVQAMFADHPAGELRYDRKSHAPRGG